MRQRDADRIRGVRRGAGAGTVYLILSNSSAVFFSGGVAGAASFRRPAVERSSESARRMAALLAEMTPRSGDDAPSTPAGVQRGGRSNEDGGDVDAIISPSPLLTPFLPSSLSHFSPNPGEAVAGEGESSGSASMTAVASSGGSMQPQGSGTGAGGRGGSGIPSPSNRLSAPNARGSATGGGGRGRIWCPLPSPMNLTASPSPACTDPPAVEGRIQCPLPSRVDPGRGLYAAAVMTGGASGGEAWDAGDPPPAQEALKALVLGPDISYVSSGDVLADAITDLRLALNLDPLPWRAAEGFTLFFDDLLLWAQARDWFNHVVPSLARIALNLDPLPRRAAEGFTLFFDDLLLWAQARDWFNHVVPSLTRILLCLPTLLEDHYCTATDQARGLGEREGVMTAPARGREASPVVQVLPAREGRKEATPALARWREAAPARGRRETAASAGVRKEGGSSAAQRHEGRGCAAGTRRKGGGGCHLALLLLATATLPSARRCHLA
uniref:Uncharacterized protein n=1 Tax=Oryza punctata TaxID=4537 RepID=A0A0E0JHU2_ORYPU